MTFKILAKPFYLVHHPKVKLFGDKHAKSNVNRFIKHMCANFLFRQAIKKSRRHGGNNFTCLSAMIIVMGLLCADGPIILSVTTPEVE